MSAENINIRVNVDNSQAQKNTDNLKQRIRELREQMALLAAAGKDNTEEYKRMAQEAGKLQDAIGDVSADIKNLANDNQTLAASLQGVGAGVAVFGALQGAAALLGVEDEKLLKTMQKIQAVQAILNSLNTIANALNKNSALMTALRAKSEGELNTELEKNVVSTEAATAATEGYTAAEGAATTGAKTLATGIKGVGTAMKSVVVIAAITAAVAALMKLIEKYNETRAEQKRLYEEHQKATQDFESSVNTAAGKVIAKYEVLSKSFSRLNGDIAEQKKFIKEHKTDFEELGLAINSVEDAENALINNKDAFVQAQLAKARAAAAQTMLEDLMKQRLELQRQREETNKLGDALKNVYSQYDDAGNILDKNARVFAESNKEIDAQIADIDKQVEGLIDDILEGTPTVSGAVTKTVKDTADLVKKLRNEALIAEKQMNINAAREWSDERLEAEKEFNDLQRRLALEALEERMKDLEISDDEKNTLRLKTEEDYQLKEIAIIQKYDERKKQNARDKEDEKLRITENGVKTEMTTLEEGSQEWYNKKIELDRLQEDREKQELERKLADNLISEELYLSEYDRISAEHAKTRAEIEMEFNKRVADDYKAKMMERVGYAETFVNAFSNMVEAAMEAELEAVGDNEAQQKEIRKKYAKAKWLSDIAGIGVSTAKSIMEAWSSVAGLTPPLNLIMGGMLSAMIGAQGALQTSQATAAMSKALSYRKGGLLYGKSHEEGGIKTDGGIELEGNEMVINKRSTAAFLPLLSAINEAGGGIPVNTPALNGSGKGQLVTTVDKNALREIVAEVVGGVVSIPVTVSERDISDSQRERNTIVSRGRI